MNTKWFKVHNSTTINNDEQRTEKTEGLYTLRWQSTEQETGA